MKRKRVLQFISIVLLLALIQSCKKDEEPVRGCTNSHATNYNPNATVDDGTCHLDTLISGCTDTAASNYNPLATQDDGTCHYDTLDFVYDPTPYAMHLPSWFPQLPSPPDNPLTIKGVQLGRKLFYDPILSGNKSQACASCHVQAYAFTDNGTRFSTGIDGMSGNRNAMAVINVAWNNKLFWDGRAPSVEGQALAPVVNPIEMHNTWKNAMANLQADPDYPREFGEAFGTSAIDSMLVAKAIAQFERTIVSTGSKYDKFLYEGGPQSDAEQRGYDLFFSEKGECFHCHGGPLYTDQDFHNNGLDSIFTDKGLFEITGNMKDLGLFKAPTLRNIELTAPYMHDGRFQTLEEVLDHYSEGIRNSPTVDPFMKAYQGGLQLSAQEKSDLIAFLKSFTDNSFTTNPDYAKP